MSTQTSTPFTQVRDPCSPGFVTFSGPVKTSMPLEDADWSCRTLGNIDQTDQVPLQYQGPYHIPVMTLLFPLSGGCHTTWKRENFPELTEIFCHGSRETFKVWLKKLNFQLLFAARFVDIRRTMFLYICAISTVGEMFP